jgi:hypothetical protein
MEWTLAGFYYVVTIKNIILQGFPLIPLNQFMGTEIFIMLTSALEVGGWLHRPDAFWKKFSTDCPRLLLSQ